MNAKDREEIKELHILITELDKRGIKTHYTLEKILSILEDDDKSSRTGLVTQVSDLNKDVEKLMYINRNIRRVSIFFLSIVSGLATVAAKMWLFGNE